MAATIHINIRENIIRIAVTQSVLRSNLKNNVIRPLIKSTGPQGPAGADGSGTWGTISGTLSSQTDLQTALDTKVDKISGKGLSTNDLTNALKTLYDQAVVDSHTHANKALLDTYTQTEANLADAVAKKHSHTNFALLETYTQTEANIADAVTKKHSHANLTALDAVTGVNTGDQDLSGYQLLSAKGVADGYASLDSGGKVPTSQLPALALTDVYSVANEAAQLALTVQEGDVAIRTDLNKSYIHNGGTAGTMADWSELLTPTDQVTSVDGRTGAVTLSDLYASLGHNHNSTYLQITNNLSDLNNAATALTNLGLTATAAEVNILDGATLTVTELNYVDGVTSAIQTQLDAKQPLDSDLTTIAGLTATTDNFIVSVSSAWASRTPSQVRTTLGLVIGTDVAAFSHTHDDRYYTESEVDTLLTGYATTGHNHDSVYLKLDASNDPITGNLALTPSSGVDALTITNNSTNKYITTGGGEFDVLDGGHVLTAGYLRVGSVSAPTNTTAGDITGVRLQIGSNSAFSGESMIVSATRTDTSSGAKAIVSVTGLLNPAGTSSSEFRTMAMSAQIPAGNAETFSNGYPGGPAGGYFEFRHLGSGNITNAQGGSFTGVTFGSSGSFTGTITKVQGAVFTPVSISGAATSNGTITNAAGVRVNNSSVGAGPLTITTLIGVDVESQTRGSTNNFGIRIAAPSGATNNYALQLSDTGGTAAGGITAGTDTNFYRPAANTWKTDDKLIVSLNLEIGQTAYFDAEVDDGNSSTADTIDWGTGNCHKSTMTGDCTYTFTAPPGPCHLTLKLVQDGTGSWNPTWPATVKWAGGAEPTWSTAASSIDIVTFYFDGTSYHGAANIGFA